MNTRDYILKRKSELESMCITNFAHNVSIDEILFDDISASDNAFISIFATKDGAVYATCETPANVSLQDVMEMLRAANLTPLRYYAPGNDVMYFLREGYEIFLRRYPGKKSWNEQEKRFYSTQALYNPSLVRIEPKIGELRRYNPITGIWQRTYDSSDVEEAFNRTLAVQ